MVFRQRIYKNIICFKRSKTNSSTFVILFRCLIKLEQLQDKLQEKK